MVIKITRNAFASKRIKRICLDEKLTLYNIYGIGLWIFREMTRTEVNKLFR